VRLAKFLITGQLEDLDSVKDNAATDLLGIDL